MLIEVSCESQVDVTVPWVLENLGSLGDGDGLRDRVQRSDSAISLLVKQLALVYYALWLIDCE